MCFIYIHFVRSYFQISQNFNFSFLKADLKCYKSITWSFTNHLWTLVITKQHKRNFLGVWESTFCNVQWFFFWVLDPFYFEGLLTFSFLICLWWLLRRLLVCHMCQEEGFKFCLDTRNKGAFSLDLACPECLSVWSLAGLPYYHQIEWQKNDET
jgi:hypothetical protein